MMCRIVGAREWLDTFWRMVKEGKVVLLLGNGMVGRCRMWESIVLVGWMVAEKEAIVV